MLNFLKTLSENTSQSLIFSKTDADKWQSLSYPLLNQLSANLAQSLLEEFQRQDLKEQAIPFLCHPNDDYLKALIGIWKAGGVTTPLCPAHPIDELEYFCRAVSATALIFDEAHREKAAALATRLQIKALNIDKLLETKNTSVDFCKFNETRAANILFTSGTTSRPKAVVTTHAALENQVQTLVGAWQRRSSDKIANVLPLHHTHGLINVVLCSLAVGAEIYLFDRFKAEELYQLVENNKLNVFMAVPTIYSQLIDYYAAQPPKQQNRLSESLKKFRLMVSGSAALPTPVFKKWKNLSGHDLLERYGMTEIGMALSNPITGERRPSTVGQPLPNVKTRIVDETGRDVAQGSQGELLIQSPSLFREYLNNPTATQEAFTDGWFKTGDIVKVEDGYFKILGRSSMDIIKSGGYKVSALEIESTLKEIGAIKEVAVIGLPDEKWGEVITACCVFSLDTIAPKLEELTSHCKERLAPYKVPRQLISLEELPKNTMGKIQKKILLKNILGKNILGEKG